MLKRTIKSLKIKNNNDKESTLNGECAYWTVEAHTKGDESEKVADVFGDYVYDAAPLKLGYSVDIVEGIETNGNKSVQKFGVSDTTASKTSFLSGLKSLSKTFKNLYK